MTIIREERTEDIGAIHHVVAHAFGRESEARLVDLLRANGKAVLSLVAVTDGTITGHILFSSVTIESADKTVPAIGLAPLAVLPEWQRSGIGSLLVRAGLEQCRQAGYECVVVLGHPEYYPRFGFIPASRYGIRSEYDVRDEAFMIAELRAGALTGCNGLAKYQPEFSEVE